MKIFGTEMHADGRDNAEYYENAEETKHLRVW